MAFCNVYGMNKRTVRSVGTVSWSVSRCHNKVIHFRSGRNIKQLKRLVYEFSSCTILSITVLSHSSQEDMPFIWDIQTSAEASSSHNSHQMQVGQFSFMNAFLTIVPQAFCISNSQQPLLCPECQRPCGRRQELKRHLLSFHLPFWIFCPYSRCPWRGHRVEGLKTHLCHQKCGPEPNRKQYEIYDSDLVVGWILDNGTSVKVAADCALAFVQGKAWELQMMEEWVNLWGN
jgi:hypothetical protein